MKVIIFLLVISLSFSNFIFSIFADEPIRIKMKGKGSSELEQELNKFKRGSEPNGFRGIKWETNISTLSNMEYIGSTSEEVEGYVRKGEILKIGSAKLKEIQYLFWKGKLFAVHVFSESSYPFDDTVFEKFGVGKQSYDGDDEYFWFGKKTMMMLHFGDGFRVLSITSQKMRKEIEIYDEKMAKEGAKTGF